jgi:hypothetical protein
MILGLSSTTLVRVLLLNQRRPPSQEKVLAWEFIGKYIFFLADTMPVLLEYYVHWCCVGSDNKLEKISHSEGISGLGRQVEFPIGSYITFFIRGPPNVNGITDL